MLFLGFCPVIELNVLLMLAANFLKMPFGFFPGPITAPGAPPGPPVGSTSSVDRLAVLMLARVAGTEESVEVEDDVTLSWGRE